MCVVVHSMLQLHSMYKNVSWAPLTCSYQFREYFLQLLKQSYGIHLLFNRCEFNVVFFSYAVFCAMNNKTSMFNRCEGERQQLWSLTSKEVPAFRRCSQLRGVVQTLISAVVSRSCRGDSVAAMLALCCSIIRDYFWSKDVTHKVQQIGEGWQKRMLVTSVK